VTPKARIHAGGIVALAIVLTAAVLQSQARAKGVDMDPPSGIVPTTATLEQVLTAHDKALGTTTLKAN